MIGLYCLLRTADLGRGQLTLWTAAAIAISVLSPVSGLVILAAIAPFSEPLTVTRQLGVKPFLIVALAAGVLIRVTLSGVGWAMARRSTASTTDRTSSFTRSRAVGCSSGSPWVPQPSSWWVPPLGCSTRGWHTRRTLRLSLPNRGWRGSAEDC